MTDDPEALDDGSERALAALDDLLGGFGLRFRGFGTLGGLPLRRGLIVAEDLRFEGTLLSIGGIVMGWLRVGLIGGGVIL
jgi:hypothetical protein